MNQQEHFDKVESIYKPHIDKYCLKPPKETKANKLRTETIFKNQSNKISGSLTALKNVVSDDNPSPKSSALKRSNSLRNHSQTT